MPVAVLGGEEFDQRGKSGKGTELASATTYVDVKCDNIDDYAYLRSATVLGCASSV